MVFFYFYKDIQVPKYLLQYPWVHTTRNTNIHRHKSKSVPNNVRCLCNILSTNIINVESRQSPSVTDARQHAQPSRHQGRRRRVL